MNRWQAHRAGLVNFWYYDDEVFQFADGKLLLRGANGSGKSVTMQSLIPLLLDGNKSPERLDPFGSRARRMEDYLLGEGETIVDERTGYLWLEFVQAGGTTRTVGLGLRARRHKPMDFWGFVLHDGRRVGHDFSLYRRGTNEAGERTRIPLNKRELRDQLGDGGVFTDSQRQYMDFVNQWIFGFDTVEEYDDLIKLLVHLRSPKLSKEFKPSVIYEIMDASLPGLSDDELRPLTEAIENMDQIQTHLAVLQRSQQAAQRIQNAYDRYNQFVLWEKASAGVAAEERYVRAEADLRQNEAAAEAAEARLQKLQQTNHALELEASELHRRENQLRQGDAFQLEEAYQETSRRVEQLDKQWRDKDDAVIQKERRERQVVQELAACEDALDKAAAQVRECLENLEGAAEEMRFHDHAFDADDVGTGRRSAYDFSSWKRNLARYRERLQEGLAALRAWDEAQTAYDRALSEQDVLQQQESQAVREEEQSHRLVDEGRQQYLTMTHDWLGENEELALADAERQRLAQAVLHYGDIGRARAGSGAPDGASAVRGVVFAAYQRARDVLSREIMGWEAQVAALDTEIADVEEEYEQWESQPDPAPERDPQTIANREALGAAGVTFRPLYQCVEFAGLEAGSDPRPALIEAALEDMGILDALFVADPASLEAATAAAGPALRADKYLAAGEGGSRSANNAHGAGDAASDRRTLADFLRPCVDPQSLEESLLEQQVEAFLASTRVDWTEADDSEPGPQLFVAPDGRYGLGPVRGAARQDVVPRFIGAAARQRYRQQMLDSLQATLTELRQRRSERDSQRQAAEQRQERLQWEYDSLPALTDLDAAVQDWHQCTRELTFVREKLDAQTQQVARQLTVVQDAKKVVYEKTKTMDLPAATGRFAAALDEAAAYREHLAELESSHNRVVQQAVLAGSLAERRADLAADVDGLRGEANVLQAELDSQRRSLRELEELRSRPEVQAMKDEVERIVRRLQAIPPEQNALAEERGQRQQLLTTLRERQAQLEADAAKGARQRDAMQEAFAEERALEFVPAAQGLTEAVSVVDALESAFTPAGLDRDLLGSQLHQVVYENNRELVDYGVTVGHLFSDGENDPHRRRFEVSGRLEGRRVSLYELVRWLGAEIEVHRGLLQETDRQLFEEVIMQTVGQRIRSKIYRAEQWVARMNQLMGSRDSSSGLLFHLQWKPKPAPHEEEMDTRELVDILKMNTTLVREDKFQRVTQHFRSKVQRARERMADGGHSETFHQVVRAVLDYRGWFEFRLFFAKSGEPRRELTNRAFDRLSGGEKAMAMYIPLFSSVYSRYQAAHVDAPHLISLDEAFAGVDETNIRDMFALMEDLGFNYIINSQVIWGDYDTVRRLAVCELVRPKNAPYVSVMRFLWDGRQRHLLLDDQVADVVGQAAGNGAPGVGHRG